MAGTAKGFAKVIEVKLDPAEVKIINKRLNALKKGAGKRALRRALRKGANIIRDQARENAKRIDDPESPEKIWKNIVTRSAGARAEKKAGGVMVKIGVMGGAKPLKKGTPTTLSGGNTTHWRLKEFGTSKVEATPFMRPAATQKAQEVLNTLMSLIKQELNKEVAKT